MRFLVPLLALLLLLTGCAKAPEEVIVAQDDRIRILFLSLFSTENGKTFGYELYLEDSDYDGPDAVVGYTYRDSKLVERSFVGMLESQYFADAVYKVGFEAFDYEGEIRAVDARLTEKQKKALATLLPVGGSLKTSGSPVEITIHVGELGPRMTFRDTIPRERIAAYARHSEKFKKLKALMNAVAENFGHAKLGI